MKNAYVPFGPVTTDKLLLLQFDSGSTTLFPYINSTAAVFNHLIECYCIVSAQPDFSGASAFATSTNTLDCTLKLPQGNYINTAISININVPINNNVKCYFPGFNINVATTISVTAKLTNKGINQAI